MLNHTPYYIPDITWHKDKPVGSSFPFLSFFFSYPHIRELRVSPSFWTFQAFRGLRTGQPPSPIPTPTSQEPLRRSLCSQIPSQRTFPLPFFAASPLHLHRTRPPSSPLPLSIHLPFFIPLFLLYPLSLCLPW